MCVADGMLFLGQNDGKIVMHDARSMERIAEVKTSGKVAPQAMCLKSPGVLLVGLANGNLE